MLRIASDTLVVDPEAGTNSQGALFRVELATGMRTLLSDFGNPAHGPVGREPTGIARGRFGVVLIMDPDAGTGERGALFQIDRTTGVRTLLSDFGNAAQGPLGLNPAGVALGGDGVILAVDTQGTADAGMLMTVDPATGMRTLRSSFGNGAQGPTGVDPFFVAVSATGNLLITDDDGGTDLPMDGVFGGNGALFSVNPTNGSRTMLSDFGNATQGPTGVNPVGIAIVPLAQPNDFFVISPFTGPAGTGELLRVDPATGARGLVSDFSNGMQGPTGGDPVDVAMGLDGEILVVDEQAPGGFGGLFVINPSNGSRTLLSNFAQAAQGPRASLVQGAALGPNRTILVIAGNGGTGNRGSLFSVDSNTGNRTLISDFGDPMQGPLGSNPEAVIQIPGGDILVIDPEGVSPLTQTARGTIFSVDPANGKRRVITDFGDPSQGPVGSNPVDLLLLPSGNLLVTDTLGSPNSSSFGVLFSVNPSTGARTIVSNFGDPAQGTGRQPWGVTLDTDGDVIVVDSIGGTGNVGVLLNVNIQTGQRTVLSDFGNAGQGPTGARPQGLTQFIEIGGGSGSNSAPTISDIQNQFTGESTATGPIPFTMAMPRRRPAASRSASRPPIPHWFPSRTSSWAARARLELSGSHRSPTSSARRSFRSRSATARSRTAMASTSSSPIGRSSRFSFSRARYGRPPSCGWLALRRTG